MNHKIFILDDEPDVTELVIYKLQQEGYECTGFNEPLSFIRTIKDNTPDLIILDIMMPEISGDQICKIIRSDQDLREVPIIFLTARGEIEDRIKGLESGADDYISKPFNNRELILRVRNILNRNVQPYKTSGSDSLLKIGDIVLDREIRELKIDGEIINLTMTEFKLLSLLMERKNRVQTRNHLLVSVWEYGTGIETRTVDTHIRRLREKLGRCAGVIKTIRGVGYKIADI
tara:strand:- start:142 stop:834 length:693 start_codon:yes stop_codon:yes gene_type:complete